MATLILAYDTALAFWSNPRLGKTDIRPLSSWQATDALLCSTTAFHDLSEKYLSNRAFSHLPNRLHLLSGRPEAHRNRKRVNVHTLTTELPNGALLFVPSLSQPGMDVLVASPEYCFVQMAQMLCKEELIELGYELCGSYAVMPRSKHGIIDCAAATSPEDIRGFLQNAEHIPGLKKAKQASKWVLADSNSPKESQLSMLFSISRTGGGRGVTFPKLNPCFHVSGDIARVLGSNTCYPDLYWPEISTVIEYDSKDRHDAWSTVDHDIRKRNVYKMLGLDAITITYGQLANYLAFDGLAREIENAFRIRREPANEKQVLAQRKLHGFLLYGQRHERFTDPYYETWSSN